MLRQLTFICSLVLSIWACQGPASSENMQKIAELENQLDSAKAEMDQIDSAKAAIATERFLGNLIYLQTKTADTLTKEQAFVLNDYYSLRKAFKLYKEKRSMVYYELDVTKKQLKDLRHDLESGAIDDKKFKEFYQIEGNNVRMIDAAADEVVYAISTVLPMYEKLSPSVDSIIQYHQQKEANSLNE